MDFFDELTEDDIKSLEDCVFLAFNKKNVSREQLKEYWDLLPRNTKLDALKWGVNDTPTREDIVVYLENNCS